MHNLEIQAAVAKIKKYASSESGDTTEIVERPRGGISVVVADGQRSGRSAKAISNIVVRKAITLLAEGVRDGAVARATHDYLHIQRGGKVSAELSIISVDLVTKTIVISRNSRCPIILYRAGRLTLLDEESEAIGIHLKTKPVITELAMEPDMTLIAFTDGVWQAGAHASQTMDYETLLMNLENDQDAASTTNAANLADAILTEAMRLEDDRPRDDATVLVIKLVAQKIQTERDRIRRVFMQFPV